MFPWQPLQSSLHLQINYMSKDSCWLISWFMCVWYQFKKKFYYIMVVSFMAEYPEKSPIWCNHWQMLSHTVIFSSLLHRRIFELHVLIITDQGEVGKFRILMIGLCSWGLFLLMICTFSLWSLYMIILLSNYRDMNIISLFF